MNSDMNNDSIPYLIEAHALESLLADESLLIVDVSARQSYLQCHLPGAVHLDYNNLILGKPPAVGLLPPLDKLQIALQSIGLTAQKHVVAYDDQGNSRASRLLWVLEAIGHKKAALLNGGLCAWSNEGHATESAPAQAEAHLHHIDQLDIAASPIELNSSVIAEQDYVLTSLTNAHTRILDARSADEYNGIKSPSLRSGHIPGAVNLNWLDSIDRDNNLRFKPTATLNTMLSQLGLKREHEIIVYCQTHHRSSHSFVMLRQLGFDKIRGYAGAWAQWGNDPNLPIE